MTFLRGRVNNWGTIALMTHSGKKVVQSPRSGQKVVIFCHHLIHLLTALFYGPQKQSFNSFNASLTQHSFIWFSFDVNLVFSWFLVNDWTVATTTKSQVIVKRFDLIIIFFFHFLVYVDMGLSSNNPITLTVVTSGSSFSRSFSIKVTQLDCYSLTKGSI